jgi:FkbM family methyltransferase
MVPNNLRYLKTLLGRFLDARFPRTWEEINILRRDHNMEAEFWLVPYLCDRNSISLDIGANTGIYTLYMSKFSRLVIAFEPNVECLSKLKSRAPENAVVVFGAVSDDTRVVELRYDRNNTGIGTVDPRNTLRQFESVDVTSFYVPTFSLDALGLKNVAFMKIDVEGHESSVLQGAMETLRRERPAVLIESENRHVAGAVQDIHSRLLAIGYSGYVLENKTLLRIPAPDKQQDPSNASLSPAYNFVFLHDEKWETYKIRLAPEFRIDRSSGKRDHG